MHRLPGGKRLFSKTIGRTAPYTGTIDARVLELREGFARVELRDRPAVRNHLGSVHAIALMNLGEVATGVTMLYGLGATARGIPTQLSMEYFKKARGTLSCECNVAIPTITERSEHEFTADIYNSDRVVVARMTARWLLSPL